MTLYNIALHLLPVVVFAVFLLILYWICRKADSEMISRFSSRRSSQLTLASRKSSTSITPKQCAINLVTNNYNNNNNNMEVSDGKATLPPPAFV